jgi:hypothetical protein
MFDWNYWLELFEARVAQLSVAPPPGPGALTPGERARIANSIATFQLGEQSEGRTLQMFAERFGARHGCPELPKVTALFIREEQHHAAQLRTFMLSQGMPLKRRQWTDSVFRYIRKLAGFEAAVTILVSAEMVGFVYYRALARNTRCAYLTTICRQMCADEAVHLRYEAQLLRTLRGTRPAWLRWLVERVHRGFLWITATIVFRDHRAVLEYAGHDATSFRRDCLALYRTVLAGSGARHGIRAGAHARTKSRARKRHETAAPKPSRSSSAV